ncbi:YbhB/YbcL family Raf kinase inhibitor-like protein [Actinospica durhamensis]|uniref:YbhB/YbcL family Raf kinase inhibitor-like protein n=1 Tax=Actinospica durhamensis TaxID=1508375 RepID=A0A941ITJ2_9ACTN|nr:YbhB/YbcL family Raf kinase inhibitor-like protein [Actinospica durhamensis]MBR7837687.1 YbhB/YbcL family Raf kinase inhibitor-like protein [Actinospica durhamensis]
MRPPHLPSLRSARARRTVIPLVTLAVAAAAAGTGAAASGHRLAESATYRAPAARTAPLAESAASPAPFTLRSSDFAAGGRLPTWTEFGGAYASEAGCSGKNLSPELRWSGAPAGTEGYALFVHDVDAPQSYGWTHWIVYDIPGSVSALPKGDDAAYTPGTTDWQANGIPQVGWGGPCPPADGETHHYVFTLYALSTADLSTSGLDYNGLMDAMAPYVLGATSIVGTFSLG